VIADEKKLHLVFDYHNQDLRQFIEHYKEEEFLDPLLVKVPLRNRDHSLPDPLRRRLLPLEADHASRPQAGKYCHR
jgi:hypothetical protein